MMMLPPITCSPPNFLTPRRRPAESRPLRDEPPAFLCAISNYSAVFFAAGFFAGGLVSVFGAAGLGATAFLGEAVLASGALVSVLGEASSWGSSAFFGAAFFSSLPIATIFRIVWFWRWPFL